MTLAPWLGMAAPSIVAAMLLTTNGFGFDGLAVPFFLLFAPPGEAIQVTIILSLAISLTVLPGLRHGIEWPLLWRLAIGSLVGVPLGLVAFAYAKPLIVRAVVGAVIAMLAAAQAYNRYHQRPPSLVMHPVHSSGYGPASFHAGGAAGA